MLADRDRVIKQKVEMATNDHMVSSTDGFLSCSCCIDDRFMMCVCVCVCVCVNFAVVSCLLLVLVSVQSRHTFKLMNSVRKFGQFINGAS